MPLPGLALRPVYPLDLTRAWRYLAVLSEEGLHDVADVLDILFFEIVVRREVEAAVSKTLGFLELNIVRLRTLEEIHGLHMEREKIIPRLDLMLPQEIPEVVLLSEARTRNTDNPRFIRLALLHHGQRGAL